MRQLHGRAELWIRVALLVLVVAWLFSESLRAYVPLWVPLVALAVVEIEYVVRARRERLTPDGQHARGRVGPGSEDADLGWGRIVETDDGPRWEPPPARRRPPRRRATLAVSALVAVVLVVAAVRGERARSWSSVSEADRAATVSRLRAEASRIAGRPVRLACDDGYAFTGARSDALGVAFPQRRLTYLHPDVCRALHDTLEGDAPGDRALGEAVLVLAHEAIHLRGERREGVTECLALQEGVSLGQRLGLSPERSASLMKERYIEALADRSVIRFEYQLPRGCRDGGTLDREQATSRFP